MFDFIGWLLFFLLGLSFVIGPFFIAALSGLGGGLKVFEFAMVVIQFFIGVFILYKAYVNAPFSIVFN